MKRLLFILFILMSVVVSAQIPAPVEWEFSQKQLSENEIELEFKANIEYSWHLYSKHIADDGPVPTEFTFTTEGGYELIGGVFEGETIKAYDPNFDMILNYFRHKAIFTQIIKVTSAEDFILAGNVYFMVCAGAMALPPEEVEFSFEIKGVNSFVEDKKYDSLFITFILLGVIGLVFLIDFILNSRKKSLEKSVEKFVDKEKSEGKSNFKWLNWILDRKKNITLSILLISLFKLLTHFFVYPNSVLHDDTYRWGGPPQHQYRTYNGDWGDRDGNQLMHYLNDLFSENTLWMFIPVTIVFLVVVWFFNDKIKAR
jgi:hypothetical protein